MPKPRPPKSGSRRGTSEEGSPVTGEGDSPPFPHDGASISADVVPEAIRDGRALDASLEKRLVDAAQKGDRRAIEDLYRSYYDVIYRYALFRVGSAGAAEDITSQVFLGMVRNLNKFRWKGKPFLAWLYGIAQKQVAVHHRSSANSSPTVDIATVAELSGASAEPDVDLAARERQSLLAGALRMLPDTQREVVLLRYVLSLSLTETAAAVSKSEGAVKQLQLRGLATLREILDSALE